MHERQVPESHISLPQARNRTSEHIRDEVYQQMMRLEAGRPKAEIELALALLRAWMKLDGALAKNAQFQWLRKICPACIAMIRALHPARSSCKRADD